jgi:hypothetical protein
MASGSRAWPIPWRGTGTAVDHPALMTLGVVLAVPDSAAMRAGSVQDYRRLELDDPRCAGVLAAMEQGAAGACSPCSCMAWNITGRRRCCAPRGTMRAARLVAGPGVPRL